MSNQSKLAMLAVIEGLTVEEMLEQATFDSVVKGICSELIPRP